ncbi:RNA polymerase sigma-70 factor (ECF subfamily) [Alkalibacillus flavidus]|uniref:RNA polymerase sigma-70 factor (ECF subfamily) n=1 Tax=Alkalibacillus flavidus TaxID=546021 RepID=A0ABV2KW49_9BACI
MTDEELIRQALAGDDSAVRDLHERYVDRVFQYLYIQTNHYHDAEELLQDVFYKAAKNLAKFKGRSSFKTWLFSICRHAVIDYYRTNKNGQHETSMDHDVVEALSESKASAESVVMGQFGYEDVVDDILDLPYTYREVLHLRFIEGLSIRETAKVMEKTTVAVKGIQKRAKKELSHRMESEVSVYE